LIKILQQDKKLERIDEPDPESEEATGREAQQ
jgi:hypothetical protein